MSGPLFREIEGKKIETGQQSPASNLLQGPLRRTVGKARRGPCKQKKEKRQERLPLASQETDTLGFTVLGPVTVPHAVAVLPL